MKQERDFEDLGYAKVDYGREKRQGQPEVIYAAGKTKEQVCGIFRTLLEKNHGCVLATRVTPEQYAYVREKIPAVQYDEAARAIYMERNLPDTTKDPRCILVVTAGTSDIPVAAEAALTARLYGNRVKTLYDCGVAGIHRLLSYEDEIRSANVIIAVAGMEGALVSVLGGLTERPVIAVPTSIGYGTAFHGVTPLLAMLNSCSAGVAVVNIDNGFGAGVLASKMNHLR